MKNALRKIIREQINLLFESFEMKNNNKNYMPTTEVAETAQTALEAITVALQKGIKLASLDTTGNQGSGRMKAKQLSQKTKQSFAEMKRLKSFFESNLTKVEEERKRIGIIQQRRGTIYEMIKSNILLVWNLHGGDACKKWVTSKLSDTHEQGNKKKERLRHVGGAYKNNGMGVFRTQYDPSQQRINK
jgi:hypothetical protein